MLQLIFWVHIDALRDLDRDFVDWHDFSFTVFIHCVKGSLHVTLSWLGWVKRLKVPVLSRRLCTWDSLASYHSVEWAVHLWEAMLNLPIFWADRDITHVKGFDRACTSLGATLLIVSMRERINRLICYDVPTHTLACRYATLIKVSRQGCDLACLSMVHMTHCPGRRDCLCQSTTVYHSLLKELLHLWARAWLLIDSCWVVQSVSGFSSFLISGTKPACHGSLREPARKLDLTRKVALTQLDCVCPGSVIVIHVAISSQLCD